jgi:hypothetical protein
MGAITVDALNPAYSSVDGVLFDKSQTTLIQCPAGKTGGFTVPNSVTSLGDQAFASCHNLTSVTIPVGITSIGGWQFFSCSSLTSITIPDSVTSLGQDAFEYCYSLTNAMIGSGVNSIGLRAFSSCTNLTEIAVSTLNAFYTSVDGVLFNKSQTTLLQCPGGKAGAYAIPDGVTTVGQYAFNACQNLASVTIPNGVTSIGYEAFGGCSKLTGVSIPDSIISFESYAFIGCASLTNVTIPNNLTSIASFAFSACTSLTSAVIGPKVNSLGDQAFYNCGALRGVYFKGNAPSLGASVFNFSTNVTVYYLPGMTGWGTTLGGRPAVCWNPQAKNLGVVSNQFGFTVTGSINLVILIEACANLADPVWIPVSTNTLTGGTSSFTDSQWTNYPSRFYRFRAL